MSNSKSNLFILALVGSLAVGCTSFKNGPDQAISIQQAHPISVDSQVVTLTLDASGTRLSRVDEARLRAFVNRYLKDGHGPVSITAPTGPYADGGAKLIAGDVRKKLNYLGVDNAALNTTNYSNGAAGGGDLIISYVHYVATPSACGLWEGMRDRDRRNLRSPNFGCSAQNNLAAMIGDPRDLIQPPALTGPDAEFRIRGVEAFRAGETTSSATDSEIETQVAN